jgi:SRSO17 transposase
LATFQVRFGRPEGEAALERSLTGLLTARPNQKCDTLAEAVPGTSAQRLQELLTTRPWDETALHRPRVAQRIAAATVGNGVLIFDDTGFAKQGQASVGVAGSTPGPWARWATVRSR